MNAPTQSTIKTYSIDALYAAVDEVSDVFCPHKLEVRRPKAFTSATLSCLETQRLKIVDLTYSAEVAVTSDPFGDFFLVTSARSGTGLIRSGRSQETWTPGATLILDSEQKNHFEFGPTFSQRTLYVDRRDFARFCSSWLGRPIDEADMRFHLAALAPGFNERWLAFVQFASGVAQSDMMTDLVTARITDLAYALLAEQTQQGTAAQPDWPTPAMVRRAEAFMHDHACEPISMAHVAAAAGCGVRTLQIAFRRHRASTPMSFLNGLRLDKVRARLSIEPGMTSIAKVAAEYGFYNLGRFSQGYEKRFGERPSQTRARTKSYKR